MTFTAEIDNDGIATLTWDLAGKSVNVWTERSMADFADVVGSLIDEPAIKGVVIASAKAVFHIGAELELALRFGSLPAEDVLRQIMEMHGIFRRMETGGTPFAAAINGHALGGGLELALACHARFVAADDRVQIGLPETKFGLIPGLGGTQRLPRLIPLLDAVTAISQGKSLRPSEALKLSLVTEIAPRNELIARAKSWLKGHPDARQPWDSRARLPSGPVHDSASMQTFSAAPATLRKQGYGNYPALQAALEVAYHGLQVPIEQGLLIEARKFVHICASAEAKAMIRTLFFGMNAANDLARRPKGPAKRTYAAIGMVGAGLMGGGIAYVAARAGLKVVLLDQSAEAAERGRAYSSSLLDKSVKQGRITSVQHAEHMDRIVATTEYSALSSCDLVIEAVFESKDLKAEVLKKIELAVASTAVIASNTSTIPITELSIHLSRPERFIGLHFFSPVDKMPLVEIISGASTSPETLAAAFDLCGAIGKTPIDVNDGRGFYTTRVVLSYMLEGVALIAEGVQPALIENAGKMAGMPMGPLRLLDMTAIDLALKIDSQNKADLGAAYLPMPGAQVMRRLVELGRLGEKTKAGFYDHERGRSRLWHGLAEFGPRAAQPQVDEVIARLMTRQAVEMLRCMEDGVVKTPEDADIGSILGWGFAPFTGGIASYVDRVGAKRLLELADRFAGFAGERFAPPRLLNQLVASGRKLHAEAA